MALGRQLVKATAVFVALALLSEMFLFRSTRLFHHAPLDSPPSSDLVLTEETIGIPDDLRTSNKILRDIEVMTESPTILLNTRSPTIARTTAPTAASLSQSMKEWSSKPEASSAVRLDPAQADFLSILPGYHSTTITHIYIPFFLGQIAKMQHTITAFWKPFPPCESADDYERINRWRGGARNNQEPPNIVFMIGRRVFNATEKMSTAKDEELIARVRDGINIPPEQRACFAPNITFCVQRLTPEEDAHVTGSRILFERLLQGKCIRGKRGYALYMEPDLRPVKKNWLTQLMLGTGYPNPSTWAIGSIYRGVVPFAWFMLEARFHMNFNGLVRVSNFAQGDEVDEHPSEAFRPILAGSFADFYFNMVRAYVISQFGANASRYYDSDMTLYLSKPLHMENFTHNLIHQYQFSNKIVNLDRTKYSPWHLERLYGEGVLMVHGGFPDWSPRGINITLEPGSQVGLHMPANWSDNVNGIAFMRKELSTHEKRLAELQRFAAKT